MSKFSNPLNQFASYEVKHILLAFDNTEAAASYAPNEKNLGKVGSAVNVSGSCGKGFVVVNEIEDTTFFINKVQWSFDFYGPLNANSSVAVGHLSVSGSDLLTFPNFLREISESLGVSTSHITFSLLTYFRGKVKEDSNHVTLTPKPLIFNIIDSHNALQEGMEEIYTYNFVAQYNTMGQLPQYSTLNQTTITHADGALGQSMPSTDGATKGIMSRKEENKIKNRPRRARLNKSKPMKSLEELAAGLQQELKDQTEVNKRQLQEFISLIRDDFVKKIKEPTQKKKGGLSTDYKIVLDSQIKPYQVNNRNIPFEQTDQSQRIPGITSMTLPTNITISKAINALLKTSVAIADDVKNGYSFKTTTSTVRTCDGKYEFTVNVARYRTPRNQVSGTNTGPGEGGIKPIKLYYGEGNALDLGIFNLAMAVGPDVTMGILEEMPEDKNGSNVVYGDREQITIERSPASAFSNSLYSGSRGMSSPVNFGLESGDSGAIIDINNTQFVMNQTSFTNLSMSGNPDLYFDLCRDPMKVAKRDADSPKCYSYPEYEPMYVDLTIRLNSDLVGRPTLKSSTYYYYTGFYHLTGVTNIINGSTFVQTLKLLRTDNVQ